MLNEWGRFSTHDMSHSSSIQEEKKPFTWRPSGRSNVARPSLSDRFRSVAKPQVGVSDFDWCGHSPTQLVCCPSAPVLTGVAGSGDGGSVTQRPQGSLFKQASPQWGSGRTKVCLQWVTEKVSRKWEVKDPPVSAPGSLGLFSVTVFAHSRLLGRWCFLTTQPCVIRPEQQADSDWWSSNPLLSDWVRATHNPLLCLLFAWSLLCKLPTLAVPFLYPFVYFFSSIMAFFIFS